MRWCSRAGAAAARSAPAPTSTQILVEHQRVAACGSRRARRSRLRRSCRRPIRATRCSIWSARPNCRRSSCGRRSRSACAARWPRCIVLTDGRHGLPDGTLVDRADAQVPGARLRRGQVRRDVAAPLPGNHDVGHRRVGPLPVRALRVAQGDWERCAPELENARHRHARAALPGIQGFDARECRPSRRSISSRSWGLTEGDLNHGQLILDQIFFMRPLPGWSNHRTPIDGLYLCGNGVHGGGGISGAAGSQRGAGAAQGLAAYTARRCSWKCHTPASRFGQSLPAR